MISPWFLVNCVANAAWIVAWHWMQVGLSVAIMLVLLGSLLVMYLRLGIGVRAASAGERWLVRAPVSIYLGWITVATIANITALAVTLGAPSFGDLPAVFTASVMVVALGIAGAMLLTRKDFAYATVIVWAFLGIWLKRSGSTEDGSGVVAMVAVAVAAVVAAVVRIREGRRGQTCKPNWGPFARGLARGRIRLAGRRTRATRTSRILGSRRCMPLRRRHRTHLAHRSWHYRARARARASRPGCGPERGWRIGLRHSGVGKPRVLGRRRLHHRHEQDARRAR